MVAVTPSQLAAPGDEHSHQKALFQWIALHGAQRFPLMVMAHAIPNGSKLMGVGTQVGRIEGGRMKAEGLRPGVPDVFVPVPVRTERWGIIWPGLYLEMKKPGREREGGAGRSPEQVKWQRQLAERGYAVATAYGWQAGAHVLALYFSNHLVMPPGGDCYMALAVGAPPW